MSSGSVGFYTRGSSPIHQLHPWTKLVFMTCVLVASFSATWLWVPAALFIISLALLTWAGVLKTYIKFIIKTIPLFAALLVIQSLFHPGRLTPLYDLGPFTIWKEGVEYAILASTRLLAIIASITILIATTRPADIVASMEDRGISHRLGYAVLLTLQIGPEMTRRIGTIMDAQRARAVEVEGNLLQRIKAFLPILGPLVTNSLLGIETRALALETRGFSIPGKRTRLHPLVHNRLEQISWWLMACATVTVVLLGIIL
jgi:energy-coupling factor transport system permease protein